MTACSHRLTLFLIMTLTASLVARESRPAAAATCAKGKQKAKKKPKKAPGSSAVSAIAPKKVTAQAIVQWKRQGASDEEIAARAAEAGYKPTPRDRAKLKRAHLSKPLLLALEGRSAAEAAPSSAGAGARPINVTKLTNPNDIDFDSVPPPQGIPKQYAHPEAKPQPKKLDHSTRPSAPFETSEDQAESDAPVAKAPPPPSNTKRVPFTATNSSE